MINDDRLNWWRESRFGLFIHWGIYSLKAKGEWVMYNERIPVQEYEKLASDFNPVQFDAEAWVSLAKAAGMKYIVITAKHHDGFSMFRTEVSPFNIVDATPFGRDVMAELAIACRREGLRLCFYYSHVREWRHPQAQSLEAKAPNLYGNYGNFWDYPLECDKNLQVYIDEFDKPQLKELLTQYGPIGLIWFDTPSLIRPDQARELVDLVHEYQPDCLVNSRVGIGVDVDYHSLGDCEIPAFGTGVDWETPMTICDWWGYNTMAGNEYRSVGELIHQLVDIASRGGNYLLNVGPDATGTIPMEAQDRLRSVGEWMKLNQEAVYGTKASPFPMQPTWGRITAKGDALYLHVYHWQSQISLSGLKNKISRITLLADPDRPIAWSQTDAGSLGYTNLNIELDGAAPDAYDSVLRLQFAGELAIIEQIIADDQGMFELAASQAQIHSSAELPQASTTITGLAMNWLETADWFSWQILCGKPGDYDLTLTFQAGFHGLWDFDHELVAAIDGEELVYTVPDTGEARRSYQIRAFQAGRIRINTPGQHTVTLRARNISKINRQGVQLASVQLRKTVEPTIT